MYDREYIYMYKKKLLNVSGKNVLEEMELVK